MKQFTHLYHRNSHAGASKHPGISLRSNTHYLCLSSWNLQARLIILSLPVLAVLITILLTDSINLKLHHFLIPRGDRRSNFISTFILIFWTS
ncbi:Protein of unknown function [Gryllus bimaculatus]|nr:Protein of unknown function [Gryllus bimaculatus]